MKKQYFTTIVILAFFCLISGTTVLAQTTCPPSGTTAGSVDTSFGDCGRSVTYVPTTINLPSAIGAVQSDGRILAVADAHLNTGISFTNVIIRYNQDGSLDMNFGQGGIVYMDWRGPNNSFGNACDFTIQRIETTPGMWEEKIVLAGSTKNASGTTILRVDRYNLDGSLDTSFGTGGTSLVNAGYALAVTTQPDGKILTMGDVGVLVRLNVNGTPDATFGSGGIVQASSVLKARSLAVQSNGRIIAAGSSTVKSKSNLTVARFNTNGSLDDGGRSDSTPGDVFGTAGKAAIDFNGAGSGAYKVKVIGGDKILAAGWAAVKNGSNDFAVARFTAAGQLDSTFGTGGKVTVDFGAGEQARKLELQANGQIVLFGMKETSGVRDFAMARLNSNGGLDAAFGTGGKVVTNFSGETEYVNDGVIQPLDNGEKIVAVGTMKTNGQAYAVTQRYIQ